MKRSRSRPVLCWIIEGTLAFVATLRAALGDPSRGHWPQWRWGFRGTWIASHLEPRECAPEDGASWTGSFVAHRLGQSSVSHFGNPGSIDSRRESSEALHEW